MTSYGEVINLISKENKTLLRCRENTLKKITNAELSITFNETCLRERLLPVYTLNIPSDGAVNLSRKQRRRPSNEQRFSFMKKRIAELHNKISLLQSTHSELEEKWAHTNINAALKENIDTLLKELIDQHKNSVIRANQNKLVKLNGGQVKYSRPLKGYINLTNKEVTRDQEELLNMGLNCHTMSKPKKFQKRIECEILIDDIEKLTKKGEVITEPTFKQEILAEATKTRGSFNSNIIERRHIDAAKQLKADSSITIRRADKAATYVLIDTSEYLQKIDEILSDSSKFEKISRDPTNALKNKINKLISRNNSASTTTKFEKLSGEYRMGYCYGNVKTHKPGNKLRPIISQIPTPTYNIAKKLCAILTPYIPAAYSLQSSTDFLDLLKNNNATGKIASLDVESLFTNVPVDRTINYILDRVYHNGSTPTLDIPEPVLRELLECCTKEAPFTCPRGKKYCQIDGVAMGSPLGVLLANFFMGCVEEEVFANINKPEIYCRYIDDIFIKTKDDTEADQLKSHLQDASGLTLTIEKSNEGSIPFLDILVRQDGETFNTQVYTKPTNPGHCLNGKSECPQRYKDSTIGAYIRRALTHCSTWKQVHDEIERATQVLINNGFSEQDITRQTKKIVDSWYNQDTTEKKNEIKVFYRAFFSTAYKQEERIMKEIFYKNVKPTDQNAAINLQIYYKSKKTSHLLLRNNTAPEAEKTQKSHVVYRFTCNRGNCEVLPSTYIGMTTTTLSRRLTFHLSNGAIKQHLLSEHGTAITRKMLEENTEIIDTCKDARRLPIAEALYIKENTPKLNRQHEDLQALPSARRATTPTPSQSPPATSRAGSSATP